ncbi:OVARIAN TUMOR DOMAIN-containing deubiquitinating enzyme 12 [Ziziphus jujuba]|uniref:ubiquitinyl hydrolase 1 n=2 Tax=Ziziphus jujuba TaxID=326968 RepID=A0A6P4AQ25_ZIZJJ|nr:OVARIAN TUMOR DOMAIN-containing deubiquitinating enzyme 12 [Ziziphus jujuba]XP_048321452.2 OVARIAN TUMOR DOMAIN-containing deubiquitinating enzyme 12 [Ziziphus jujuba]
MAINEFHSDLMQWGLRLLDGDPYNSSGYYGQMMQNDADGIYQGHYVRDQYETESNNVENDEIIALTLQEEFSQIAVTEASGYLDTGGSHASNFVNSWHSPSRGNYYSGHDRGREEVDSVLPSSSCSSPGDQEEYLHSLELADEYTDDNQVHWNFDQMTPIPHVPRINGEIPPSDEVTSDHQTLQDRLQLHDFVEHTVQGDGNCQFRALSDQLYGTPDHHNHVRQQVVNQLKSEPEIYEGYVPMAYDDYLEKMSQSGEWGDHVTLQAAADMYGVKIFVITSFKDPYCIEIIPKSRKPKQVIYLSFWAEVHYNSIYPQGDIPTSENRKKKRWWSFGNKH